MTLTCDPADLRPEFQKGKGANVDQAIPTSQVGYEHLNDKAQEAVRAVGRATYYNWTKDTYNAIYPPK